MFKLLLGTRLYAVHSLLDFVDFVSMLVMSKRRFRYCTITGYEIIPATTVCINIDALGPSCYSGLEHGLCLVH